VGLEQRELIPVPKWSALVHHATAIIRSKTYDVRIRQKRSFQLGSIELLPKHSVAKVEWIAKHSR
jgi:hypothetical protein